MNVLTADIDFMRIVRREGDRESPLESVFEIGNRPSAARGGVHRSCLTGANVEVLQESCLSAGPNEIGICGIRVCKSTLRTAGPLPISGQDLTGREAVARAAMR